MSWLPPVRYTVRGSQPGGVSSGGRLWVVIRSYFGRRLAYMVLCLFVVATMVFFMFRLIPGNPIGALMDPSLDAEAVKMLEQRFGLNEPLHTQYCLYLRNLIQGEFGTSFFYRKPAI